MRDGMVKFAFCFWEKFIAEKRLNMQHELALNANFSEVRSICDLQYRKFSF
jgi:hypothetical protein